MRQGAIYQIPCHDCDFSYIGETKRSFSIHKKEHLANIRHLRFDKSALTKHQIKSSLLVQLVGQKTFFFVSVSIGYAQGMYYLSSSGLECKVKNKREKLRHK